MKRALIVSAIMGIISAALIAPWTYRNWKVFHQFIPLTNDLGHALAKANTENIYGLTVLGFPQEVQTSERVINPDNQQEIRYVMLPEAEAALREQGWLKPSRLFTEWHPREPFDPDQTCNTSSKISETEFDTHWKRIGWISFKEQLRKSGFMLPIIKIRSFWSPFLQPSIKYGTPWTFGNTEIFNFTARWSLAGYTLLLEFAALFGLVIAVRKKRFAHLIPILIVIGIYTIMHAIFAGYTKYRIPLDNLLAVIGAMAAVWLYDSYRHTLNQTDRTRSSLPVTSTFVVNRLFHKVAIRWKSRVERMKKSWRIWLPTGLLIGIILVLRLLSFSLFWEYAAKIGDPGFKILVDHWFKGFGYSFAPDFGCLTAFRSPGYLFFITGVYLLFGFENYFVLLLIQSLIAVAAAYLIYRLAYALTHDRRVGWAALIFFALNPYTFYHYTQFYHTVLSSFLLVLLLWALVCLEQTKRLSWSFLAGIAIGCLALIQGTILPATPFLSLWILVRWRNEWKRALLAILIMAGTSAALIAPWTYRNWTVFHGFVPLTTDVGFGLYKTNNPYSYALNDLGYAQEVISGEAIVNPDNPLVERYFFTAEVEDALRDRGSFTTTTYISDWHPRPPGYRDSCALMSSMSEPDFAVYWTNKVWDWIGGHFWPDFVKLQIQKVRMFWSPFLTPAIKSNVQWPFEMHGTLATIAPLAHIVYMIILELTALAGIVVVVRRKTLGGYVPLLIVLAVYTFMHSIFPGYTKYRVPLDNILFVFGGILVIALFDRYRKRKQKV